MKIYTDKRLLACGLVGGTLSRHSGNMREMANQAPIFTQLGIKPAHMLHFHQVHGSNILTISTPQEAQMITQQPLQEADGWVFTPLPAQWGAALVTADCVPVFVWDNSGQYAALAHCGWRGVVNHLAQKCVQRLLQHNSTLQLNAWLGPHIQACCFEVQQDVAAQFAPDCVTTKNGKLFVNLNTELIRQLTSAGIPTANIHAPYYCTCGDKENFFSWRRDHEKNLLLSFIYKP